MKRVQPLLCFSNYGSDDLLPFARSVGMQCRESFLRKLGAEQYRLDETVELLRRNGTCALFSGATLEVTYFSEELSDVVPLLKEYCGVGDYQRIHDQLCQRFLGVAADEPSVQLPQFWLLLSALLQLGFLSKADPSPSSQAPPETRVNTCSGLMILPTLTCNYRCDYCYHRNLDPALGLGRVLSSEQARRGIDYFLANTSVPKDVVRSIRVTGGEPTLHYELVSDILDYAAEIRRRDPTLAPFKLTMVTNGALLDERWIALIKAHDLGIAVSLDGRQPRNDLRRKSLTGSAYLRTAAGIRRLVAAGVKPTVIATISSHNIGSIADDIAWIFEELQPDAFSLNLDTSDVAPYRLSPAQFATGIIEAYDELSYRGLFDSKVIKLSQRFRSKRAAITGCGGVFSQIVLFPDGSIGPCPYLTGTSERMAMEERQALGTSALFERWATYNYALNSTCQRCNYRYICSGWCPAVSLQFIGKLSEPTDHTCLYTKRLIEWLIWYDFEQMLREQAEPRLVVPAATEGVGLEPAAKEKPCPT